MTTIGDPTPPAAPQQLDLSIPKRLFAALLSLGLFAIFGATYYYRQTITEAAPACTDGPDGCVVYVDRLPDAALVIALLALAAIVGLIAATGRLWTIKVAGVEAAPVTDTAIVADGTDEAKKVEKEIERAERTRAIRQGNPQSPGEVWQTIPVGIRQKADAQWDSWFPGHSLALDVAENIGTIANTSTPYYLKATNPENHEIVLLRIGQPRPR